MSPTPPSEDRFGAADDVLREVLDAEPKTRRSPLPGRDGLGGC